MSITVTYYRLTPKERERVTHDQPAWEQFRKTIQDAQFQAMHAALASLSAQPSSQEDALSELGALLQQSRDPRRFDMEKEWHTFGYLLTGRSEIAEEHRDGDALHNVIFGGLATAVTTGYGAVRYYDERLVAQSADALRAADRQLVASRFDPPRMAELDIYAAPEAEERDGVLSLIEDFAGFFGEAASAREDVIKFAV